MTSSSTPVEPTRPLPMPVIDEGGNMHAVTALSPKLNTTRGRLPIPPDKVMPVIVVPGIMGSNLRASAKGKNKDLKPGEQAWRPPNGIVSSLKEVEKWKKRSPTIRQNVLDGDTLEVDPTGEIFLPPSMPLFTWDEATARSRGWGEIHASSYGGLLIHLQSSLNITFRQIWGKPVLEEHWEYLNKFDRARWNTTKTGVAAELSIDEMKKFAEFHYPVYAFGYNWLQSNETSAAKLRERIEEIIASWKNAKRQCDSVLLVSHSMGGLVTRACAKQIPGKIAGIIHGVMPALGAPVCYRRLACGTERSSPTNSYLDNKAAEGFSDIAGKDAAETTPILALSPGPLELLPNHLYPKPWLFLETTFSNGQKPSIIELPFKDPYKFYRDFKVWYRAIDLALVDPANNFDGAAEASVGGAIDQAEHFHTKILDTYYHPKTFAFYGADTAHASFGSCRWISRAKSVNSSPAKVDEGVLHPQPGTKPDERVVQWGDGSTFPFRHSAQDTAGDGTVPWQSGAGPEGKILQVFRVLGFDHQGSYSNDAILSLTLQLLVRLVQNP